MHRGGEGVVRGLALVDVVIGVNAAIGVNLFGPVSDDLVRVHVGRSAGSGLVSIDREVLIVLAFEYFAGCFFNCGGLLEFNDSEFTIGLGCGEFNESISADHEGVDGLMGDGKVEDGALGGGSIESRSGDWHFSHGVAFDTCFGHRGRDQKLRGGVQPETTSVQSCL